MASGLVNCCSLFLFAILLLWLLRASHIANMSNVPAVSRTISALSEVIQSQQVPGTEHEPTATEFFALICSTLGASSEINDHTLQLLEILEGVTLQSAPLIVKSQFKPLSAGLLRILSSLPATDNWNRLLRLSLTVLGSLLQMQDTSEGVWGNMEMMQCINAFLGFMDDARLKIRKTTQDQLLRVMSHHVRHHVLALRSYVSDFCQQVMGNCTRSEYKRSLHLLLFLEKGAALLPAASLIGLFETIIRLQQCEQPVLTAAVFRTCDAFFQNPQYPLSLQQTCALLNILFDTRQQIDMESSVYRCTAMASGFACLHKQSKLHCFALLPRCTSALIEGCETEFTQIHTAVSIALKRIMGIFITDDVLNTAVKVANVRGSRRSSAAAAMSEAETTVATNFAQFITLMESLLMLRYQSSWTYAIDAIKSLFERVRGDRGAVVLSSLLSRLAETFEATEQRKLTLEPSQQLILQDALSAALRCLGISNFVGILPMRSFESPAYVGIDESREWILTIFHANLKLMPCSLSDFETIILGTVHTCEDAVAHPDNYALNFGQVQIIRNRVLQLWSLFPGFCIFGPTDIVAHFPTLAPILVAALKSEVFPEIVPLVISGLTHLATKVRANCPRNLETPAFTTLKAQAHIILPACLMFLEFLDLSDNKFQGGVQCVAAWASVSPPPLVGAIATKILQLLLATTTASAQATAAGGGSDAAAAADAAGSNWLAVTLAIIPHLPTNMVVILYKTVRPLLSVNESVSSQKRAYSVLDSLLQHCGEHLHQSESRSDILGVVSDSILTCHVSARNMRLRCMEALLKDMSEEELGVASASILGEVLICQKDSNKKSRDCAVDLLKLLIRRSNPQEMLVRLCSAVVGETAVMRSSAIIGICMLFLDWRQDLSVVASAAQLFPTLTMLLREECAELTRAVLSYIRVCVSILRVEVLVHADLLPMLVASITTQLGPFKSKFSSRVRAIMRKLLQRVGEEAVRPYVPLEDVALLDYIQRQARRAKRKKDGKDNETDRIEKMLGSDSESDDDDDDEESGGGAMDQERPMRGNSKEDYRIASRPKAIRVKDVRETLPASLDDLLEDQAMSTFYAVGGSSSSSTDVSSSKRGRGGAAARREAGGTLADLQRAQDLDDEDANYRVIVSASGQVTIQEKEETVKGMDIGDKGGKRGNGDDDEGAMQPSTSMSTRQADAASKKKRSEPGSEYRSKKAGGDVWKKGMLEPHAYIPLDARLLNKKNHREAVSYFGAVVKNGKKAGAGQQTMPSHVTVGNRNQRMAARKGAGSGKGNKC